MLGGDPGSYEKAEGGEGRGTKLFPRLELVSVTFRRSLKYFPKKQHQKHIKKSPWYVNIIMQSVAQAKFPIDTRWMLYSILGNFGVSSTKNLLWWKRTGVGVDPLNEILVLYNLFFKKFSAEQTSHFHHRVSPPPSTLLKFVVENRKSCVHANMLYRKNTWNN